MTENEVTQLLKGRWKGSDNTEYLFSVSEEEEWNTVNICPFNESAFEWIFKVSEKGEGFLLHLNDTQSEKILELNLQFRSPLSIHLVKDGKAVVLRKIV